MTEVMPSRVLPEAPLAPAPPPISSSAVAVKGFGKKGEGKMANYGIEIPPPTIVEDDDLPVALRGASSSASGHADTRRSSRRPPVPIAATSELVESWIASCFTPLHNLSRNIPPEIGESILWRGVKTGRAGMPSTALEHFAGIVRYIEVEEATQDLFIYVD